MAIFKRFGRKKRRKYPVKVDQKGRSARSRCFDMFAEKVPIDEIAEEVGAKVDTVRRYHQQWKKDPGLEPRYAYIQSLFKKTAPGHRTSRI
jgi:DNA invertase Pin-like site-specific DNA recombinase